MLPGVSRNLSNVSALFSYPFDPGIYTDGMANVYVRNCRFDVSSMSGTVQKSYALLVVAKLKMHNASVSGLESTSL